ncbi:MAG: hypothetical protein JO148_10270 [Acidimicrobiia bacterium]|nr:hypothetical protein [Acidimicrobiia bacterium]
MRRARRTTEVTVAPYTVALAAVAGAWLAHGLEYVRVWGWGEFGSATSRQVHTYMGPVGLVLVLLAFVGVEAGLRSFRRLERVLAGLSNGTVEPTQVQSEPRRFAIPITSLLSLIWVLQLVVYVIQENAELRAEGIHQPILNVLTGPHIWAAGVHLLVAALLVGTIWLLHRPLAQLADVVRQVVAWLVASQRRAAAGATPAPSVRSWTPAERFGRQLWSRPPPVARAL